MTRDTTRTTLNRNHAQTREIALVYTLASICTIFKRSLRKLRCVEEAWSILKTTFRGFSKRTVDNTFFRSQNVQLPKEEKVAEFPNPILKLVSELDGTGHPVSDLRQKAVSNLGELTVLDVTVGSLLAGAVNYYKAC